MGFNFDTAMHQRTLAASKGIGSKEWIEFAHMMFDEFPALYETARKMTVHQDDLARERDELLKSLEKIADDGIENSRDPRTLIAKSAIAKATA